MRCWNWTRVTGCCCHITTRTQTWSTSVERYRAAWSPGLGVGFKEETFFLKKNLCVCVCAHARGRVFRETAASDTLRSRMSRRTFTTSAHSAVRSRRGGWASCPREAWTSASARLQGETMTTTVMMAMMTMMIKLMTLGGMLRL